MKSHVALICFCLIGCAGASRESNPGELPPDTNPAPVASFIPTDSTFKASPRSEPSVVLLDEKELRNAPPFRAVGVLQMEGKETKRLSAFYDTVANAGASMGCDVLYQRDAFELGTRVQKLQLPTATGLFPPVGTWTASNGRVWRRNDRVVWQFLCGLTGASDVEQQKSIKDATFLAVQLRRKALGNFEPCDPYTPTGSHVRRNDVCANDPKRRNVADASTVSPFGW